MNLVQKMMLFFISAHSIVESEIAHSGLLRTVFKSFGNKKLARLERWHMCWVNEEIFHFPGYYFILCGVLCLQWCWAWLCWYWVDPRSTSPLTMFVSFVQIMAEKLGQNLVGRLSNKRKFLVSGKNLLCLWPVTAGEVSAGDVS